MVEKVEAAEEVMMEAAKYVVVGSGPAIFLPIKHGSGSGESGKAVKAERRRQHRRRCKRSQRRSQRKGWEWWRR